MNDLSDVNVINEIENLDFDVGSWESVVIAAVMLVIAFPSFTFFGQRLFVYVLSVATALGSAYGTYYILLQTNATEVWPQYAVDILVAGIGIVGGSVALLVDFIGIFALGAVSGSVISNLIFQYASIGNDSVRSLEWVQLSIVAGGAAIFGVLMVLIKYDIEKVITSFVGAYFGVAGINYFLYWIGDHIKEHNNLPTVPQFWPTIFFNNEFHCTDMICYILLGIWGALFILGVIVQYSFPPAKSNDNRNGDAEAEPLLRPQLRLNA